MGNTCCNERGDDHPNMEVKKASHAYQPRAEDGVHRIVPVSSQDIKKEPSEAFNVDKNMLAAMDKHKFDYGLDENPQKDFPCDQVQETEASTGRSYKYIGQVNNGKKEGLGQLQFQNGNKDLVVCNFDNDKANGKGSVFFENGDTFQGSLKDNEMSQGKLYLNNGVTYEGPFQDNLYEGKGSLTFPDKRKYEGDFHEGKRAGFGKYSWPDGAVYEGEWKNGKQHGRGKYTEKNGVVHQGRFHEGKKLK